MFALGRHQLGTAGSATSEPGFTPRTQQVLVMASEEAQREGKTAISPRHLLVAILREGQGIAAQLLQSAGVRWEQVGETVHISVIPETDEGPVTVPTDLQESLQQHPTAQSHV
jgi:ATP-dependent Clp protease ATP-binding subunit ClpA